jgi:hypothetical protein
MEFLIIPAIVVLGLDTRNSQATMAATVAYTKQSGIERMVDDLQQREISQSLRNRIGQATFIVKTISSQSITYRLEFP